MSVRHFFRRPRSVAAVQAMTLIDEGAVVVDVRGRREWERQHIPGSLHIPLSELEERAEEIPEGSTVITFCTGGLLSSGAANLLTELGIDAVSLGRGLVEWRAAGGPLETSTPGSAGTT